ncbi:hypothetical protein OIU84_005335 [Salix udensis]|uniref:Uncharacterized protein n=1 Tax=Salix udensis TaxID=889485 RepID=A0AAD6JVW3_9ROSI|nr:hypothetical protein OIU84_005335 [Salix udensis]
MKVEKRVRKWRVSTLFFCLAKIRDHSEPFLQDPPQKPSALFTFTCLERSLLPDEWKPFDSRFILSTDGDGRDGVHLVTEAELKENGSRSQIELLKDEDCVYYRATNVRLFKDREVLAAGDMVPVHVNRNSVWHRDVTIA